MAVYNLDKYTAADGLGFPMNFRRGAPNPLDNSAVWASYDEAHSYAQTDPTAYVGQVLTIVSDADGVKSATVYVIDNAAGDLKKVGTTPVGDEKTVAVAADGTVSLVGISGLTLAEKTYQPLLSNGVLTWVEPSATTVEGLDARLSSAESKVNALESAVGKKADGENAATGLYDYVDKAVAAATPADYDALKESVAANSSKIGTVAEGQTLAQMIADQESALKTYVGEEIGKQAHFSAKVVTDKTLMTDSTTLYLFKPEGADSKADAYEQYLVIDGVATMIGETSLDLSGYATTSALDGAKSALESEIQAIAGDVADLQTADTGFNGRISALESVGAQANYVKSVTEELAVSDSGELSIVAVASSKVTGLADALAGKVNAVEGSRLLTADEASKLEKLVLGEDGSVSISGEINASNVKELGAWIDQHRDDEAIHGLFKTAYENKLNGIAEGAEVNVIETIKIEGAETALPVAAKTVELPLATAEVAGLVKASASTAENKVAINSEDGTMELYKLNVNRLIQTEGETLVLDGGTSNA